jgi:hypothetical protein
MAFVTMLVGALMQFAGYYNGLRIVTGEAERFPFDLVLIAILLAVGNTITVGAAGRLLLEITFEVEEKKQ